MKVYVVYDTPWGEQCDKRWLYEGLSQKYDCELIVPDVVLSRLGYRGLVGKITSKLWVLRLSATAAFKAHAGDVVVAWSRSEGFFTSRMARGGVIVVSLNWLTPQPTERFKGLSRRALLREHTWVGINCSATREALVQAYGITDTSRIFWVPDVPAEGRPEFVDMPPADRPYIFTGGMNNRDWPLVLEIARRRPEYEFECVARSGDWDSATAGLAIPANVHARFDTPADEYYGLLAHSRCMLLPLRDDRVAGLINIIKAVSWGVVPVISENTAMRQYLPPELKGALQFEVGDAAGALERLDAVWAMSETDRATTVASLRAHLEANFTSDRAIACIDDVISRAVAL